MVGTKILAIIYFIKYVRIAADRKKNLKFPQMCKHCSPRFFLMRTILKSKYANTKKHPVCASHTCQTPSFFFLKPHMPNKTRLKYRNSMCNFSQTQSITRPLENCEKLGAFMNRDATTRTCRAIQLLETRNTIPDENFRMFCARMLCVSV